MTVCGCPFTEIARSMIPGSEPYRVRHTSSLRITAGAAPGRSSSGLKSHPRTGRSPMRLNSDAETTRALEPFRLPSAVGDGQAARRKGRHALERRVVLINYKGFGHGLNKPKAARAAMEHHLE